MDLHERTASRARRRFVVLKAQTVELSELEGGAAQHVAASYIVATRYTIDLRMQLPQIMHAA